MKNIKFKTLYNFLAVLFVASILFGTNLIHSTAISKYHKILAEDIRGEILDMSVVMGSDTYLDESVGCVQSILDRKSVSSRNFDEVSLVDDNNIVLSSSDRKLIGKKIDIGLDFSQFSSKMIGKPMMLHSTHVHYNQKLAKVTHYLVFSISDFDSKIPHFSFPYALLALLYASGAIIFLFVLKFMILVPVEKISKINKDNLGGYKNTDFKIFEMNQLKKGVVDTLQAQVEINENLNDLVEEKVKEIKDKEAYIIEQAKLASMGEMIAAIAHQWRQPLNTIGIIHQYMEDLTKPLEGKEEEVEELSDQLMITVRQMSGTIDDFRYFYSKDKSISVFNVFKLIFDYFKMYSIQTGAKGIHMNLLCKCDKGDYEYMSIDEDHTCDHNLMLVKGSAGEFRQVIQNLFSNAADAIAESKIKQGSINTYIELDNNNISIIVEDNGGGITNENLNRIFEPYFTTKDEGKGTGLGLYISNIIIRDHFCGKLTVENAENGARFTITIPAQKK